MNDPVPTFIVDSFTKQPFKGNPAAVCLLDSAISAERMQQIAQELNLSETAFVVMAKREGRFPIRYFSPKMEIPLCGHATLASAKILFEQLQCVQLDFVNGNDLQLNARNLGDQIEMEFPVYELASATAKEELLSALGVQSILYSGFEANTKILLVEIACADQLQKLAPDFVKLRASQQLIHGVCVTAKGNDQFDFHSRYFWPWSGGEEDPVTGGTHTFLAKYWGDKLGKTVLRSFQSSARTGQMEVELAANGKLLIRGQACIVFEGVMRPTV